MEGFIRNILTVDRLRARIARNNAVVRLDTNGKIYKYNADSTALHDGANVIKPISVGTGPGAWENVSRATRYFNSKGEITIPLKIFADSYVPDVNPFTINFSHVGFTEIPFSYSARVREVTRTGTDYADVKITEVTKTSMTVELLRPNAAITVSTIANQNVKLTKTGTNNLAGLTVSVSLMGF